MHGEDTLRLNPTVPVGEPAWLKASVPLGDEGRLVLWRPVVTGSAGTLAQLDRLGQDVVVLDGVKQVSDAVQARPLLVVGLDGAPGRLGRVGVGEHRILGLRVLDPQLARLDVHWAELPALGRVRRALLEAPLLFLVAHREPVLQQDDPRANEHPLELGAGAQELLVLGLGAEPHDPLDPGAVVPTPIEENHLPGGGKMRDVALEIPLSLLTRSPFSLTQYCSLTSSSCNRASSAS